MDLTKISRKSNEVARYVSYNRTTECSIYLDSVSSASPMLKAIELVTISKLYSWTTALNVVGSLTLRRLRLNADKTELIWLGTRQQLLKVTHQPNGVGLAPVSRVHGLIIHEELTHVNHVVGGCSTSSGSCEVSGVTCRSLPGELFISSRPDYCNATLYEVVAGSIHRLQIVMIAATCMVTLHYRFTVRADILLCL